MMHRLAAALLVIAAGLGGCATEIKVHELDPAAPAGSKVDGIPVYAPNAYRVHVLMLGTDGTYKEQALTGGATATIPDTSRLYVIGFKGWPLATHTIEIALNDNGTVDHVNQNSTADVKDALTQLGTSAVAVKTQLAANRTAANQQADDYEAARGDYYSKLGDYCTASKASPLDVVAVKGKAQALRASELKLRRAHDAAKSLDALPFATVINPDTDVGLGCPS